MFSAHISSKLNLFASFLHVTQFSFDFVHEWKFINARQINVG